MVDFVTYGLLGSNISDSFRPGVYNAFFDEIDMPAVFIPFPADKERLIVALPVLRSRLAGFNVEAPFRLDIMAHMDKLDETAKRFGAVDTVKAEDGKLTGFNTCAAAFEKSLVGFMGNVYDKDVLLVGSGGVAYSVANVLMKKGAFLSILSKNQVHASSLKDALLLNKYNKNRIKVLKGTDEAETFYAAVNTSSVDLEGDESELSINTKTYHSFKYVYDVRCGESAFLKKAAEYGVEVKDGFDMMFYDSVGSLGIWLGKENVPRVDIISKVYDHLKERYLLNMGALK